MIFSQHLLLNLNHSSLEPGLYLESSDGSDNNRYLAVLLLRSQSQCARENTLKLEASKIPVRYGCDFKKFVSKAFDVEFGSPLEQTTCRNNTSQYI